jgi:hypothetical protein
MLLYGRPLARKVGPILKISSGESTLALNARA